MPAIFEDDLTLEEREELDHGDRNPPPRPAGWRQTRLAAAILAVALPLAFFALIKIADSMLRLHSGAPY